MTLTKSATASLYFMHHTPSYIFSSSFLFLFYFCHCVSFCLTHDFKLNICPLLLSGQLRTLIVEAQSRGLRFVYALSPGQDIVFSSSCDLTLLRRKLRQVQYITHS